jgi:hypothetical protein
MDHASGAEGDTRLGQGLVHTTLQGQQSGVIDDVKVDVRVRGGLGRGVQRGLQRRGHHNHEDAQEPAIQHERPLFLHVCRAPRMLSRPRIKSKMRSTINT